jgi:hypothetical protein
LLIKIPDLVKWGKIGIAVSDCFTVIGGLLMLLTNINTDDVNKFNKLRIDRLACFFTSTLPFCEIQIDHNNKLVVYCPSSKIMHSLLHDLDDLYHYSWLILGVKVVVLYLAQTKYLSSEHYAS